MRETLARLARIDPELLYPVQHRSAQAQVGSDDDWARAGLVRARTGLVEHGSRVDQELRRTLARL